MTARNTRWLAVDAFTEAHLITDRKPSGRKIPFNKGRVYPYTSTRQLERNRRRVAQLERKQQPIG